MSTATCICGDSGDSGKRVPSVSDESTLGTSTNNINSSLPLVCSTCDERFADALTFASHVIAAHSKQACGFCGEGYYQHAYQQHLMDSKLHPKCCQCRVGFEDPVRFDEHLWTFHPEGGCKNCQVHCRTTAHLQQHYDDSPFHPVCEHCGSGFVDTTVLSKHVDCVHLNDGAAYFQQGRPIGLKDDSLRTQSPPSPSDLSSLLGHRSDSLGSDDSTILMLPPCACERNSLHEFVDRPSDPVGSPSRPQSWRNTLTPVTEASSTASRAPSPCPSEWSDYTTEPAVVAATPSVSASMAPSSPQRRQSPSRRTSLFGDASPSEADHRGARTPTTSRASLRSKSSAIPQFPSSMQAVEPVMSGPPPRKAKPDVHSRSGRTTASTSPQLGGVSSVRSPIITTDSETVSSISESLPSSATIPSPTPPLLPEGGNEASLVSVARCTLACSGIKQRVYDQPTAQSSHIWDKGSAQHLELPNSTRPVEQGREVPPASLTPLAPPQLGSLHCRMCMQDPSDKPTATLCGHIFCRSCISEAVTRDFQCPVCKRAILVPLNV